jgi:transcriptional regulator with XRE-family HTH domain
VLNLIFRPKAIKDTVDTNKFGEMVRVARLEKGWSQRELARRSKKSATYITYIESGRNPSAADNVFKPSRDAVEAISRALGLNMDEALMAAGFAPDNQITLRKPQTLDELIDALEQLGISNLMFHEHDRLRTATPRQLQEVLDAVKLAVQLIIARQENEGGNNSSGQSHDDESNTLRSR